MSWNLQGAQALNWENALAEARWGRGVGDLEEGAIWRPQHPAEGSGCPQEATVSGP